MGTVTVFTGAGTTTVSDIILKIMIDIYSVVIEIDDFTLSREGK
jgi:phosphoribulokinase